MTQLSPLSVDNPRENPMTGNENAINARVEGSLDNCDPGDVADKQAEQRTAKCDGDHGGPRCADPECWNDSPAEPVKVPSDVAGFDAKALATAQEIALMWGHNRSQFVSRIQVAVAGAMRWAQASQPSQPPASVLLDFDQVGRAGPFPVVDGCVAVPAVTVIDLVRMVQPAASAELAVTDAMHAHFEGIYNGLDLAERKEIIEGILRLAAPVAAQPTGKQPLQVDALLELIDEFRERLPSSFLTLVDAARAGREE